MNMKSILWFQAATIGKPDVVCCDGKILESVSCSEAFSRLKEASDASMKHKSPWYGVVRIPCGKVRYLKGTLKEKDEYGRSLTFMFLSAKCDDPMALLQGELQVVNKELSDETLLYLKKKESNDAVIKLILILGILALLLITIIVAI